MIVQDQYSGYFHEVPDQLMGNSGYGLGEVVYDGFGNPVGFNPFDIIKNVVSNIPIVGGLVSNLLPGGSPSSPPVPSPFVPPIPFPPSISSAFSQFRPPTPWPLGWNRPTLPYTGLGPKRLYMRCAVWPGPKGLVPGYAANMPPGMLPGQPGVPALPGPYGGGRRRRRSRRR